MMPTTGPGSVVSIATGHKLDGLRIEYWWGSEIFRTWPDWPWGPPSSLYNGYWVFPRGKERPGRDADPSPLLVLWSWKSRAIRLLPLWAKWPVQGCTLPFCYAYYSIMRHVRWLPFNYIIKLYIKNQRDMRQKLDGQADTRGRRLSRPAWIFSFDMAGPSCWLVGPHSI
jgi:hypothetical protein